MDSLMNLLAQVPGIDHLEHALVCVCDRQRIPVLYALHFGLLAFSLYFATLAFQAIGMCYVTPCSTLPDLEAMWQVDNGLSFELVAFSCLFILHAIAGVLFLHKKTTPQTAGTFIGLSVAVCLCSLSAAVTWGGKAAMVIGMTGTYVENGQSLRASDVAITVCKHLSTASTLIFSMCTFSTCMLSYAPSSICNSAYEPAPEEIKAKQAGIFYRTTDETRRLMHDDDSVNDESDNPFTKKDRDINELTI